MYLDQQILAYSPTCRALIIPPILEMTLNPVELWKANCNPYSSASLYMKRNGITGNE